MAEASTREQAIAQIREMIKQRLSSVEMIEVEVPDHKPSQDSWTRFAGCLRGHPDAAEVEDTIKEYRREVDADPQRLRAFFGALSDVERFLDLRKTLLRIGKLDLAIAAIALGADATVVTRNRQDFDQVPGLRIEDWSKPRATG